jgi:hypothetical protein
MAMNIYHLKEKFTWQIIHDEMSMTSPLIVDDIRGIKYAPMSSPTLSTTAHTRESRRN